VGITLRVIRFESHMYQAREAEQRMDWEGVAREAIAAVNAGPFHEEAVHLSGFVLNRLGRFPDAHALYEASLLRRPNDIQILNGIGASAKVS
ncbi:MAG: hypothetical protein QF834_07455, partial [Candidatus Thalassarchaeaceae archaeon]|nr:hypothetical protein [Candidatus Thalassarchaeaceae archaeon]